MKDLGNELRIYVAQQNLDGRIDGDGQGGGLAQHVADSIDNQEGSAHTIVFTQLQEAVVSTVHHQVLGKVVGVEHQAPGKGSQECSDSYHGSHENHGLGEFRRRFFQVVYIRRQLFAAAYGKDQNGQGGHVVKVEGGHQGIPIQAVGKGLGGGQMRCGQGKDDIQQGHDEHGGTGQSADAL